MESAMLSSLLCGIYDLETYIQNSNCCSVISEDLCAMKELLPAIQAVIGDADVKSLNDENVTRWLQNVREAACLAVKVVDETGYELMKYEAEVSDRSRTITSTDDLFITLASNVRNVVKMFDEISHKKHALFLKENWSNITMQEHCELQSDEPVLYGREEDKTNLIEMLLSESQTNSIIYLVGSAGIGKTTLIRVLYDDPIVHNHFGERKWLYMSRHSDATWFQKLLLEYFTNYRLIGQRVLLIVDEFCVEDKSLWKIIKDLLSLVRKGSKVLVIADDQQAVSIAQTVPSYHLKNLLPDTSYLLFQHYAFGSQQQEYELNLIEVGNKIVDKCNGSPLFIKMIGVLLNSETREDYWNSILHSDLWDSDGTLAAVKLSFLSLPSELKTCLSYCSIFPEDYLFKKDYLVRLWKAEGFVCHADRKQSENLAYKYFDELLRRSFFQHAQIGRTFMIHPLVRDLIVSISRNQVCRMESPNLCTVPSTACHLFLTFWDSDTPLDIYLLGNLQNLRSFLTLNRLQQAHIDYFPDSDKIRLLLPNDSFSNMKSLRVLNLSDTDLVNLPDSIAILKHLRYLSLNRTSIRFLPESLSKLYHLQTLELQDCFDLIELPRNIVHLRNLQHVLLPNSYRSVLLPRGIGKLTKLETLSTFLVGGKENHYVIRELEGLVNITGDLRISGLANVIDVDDAKAANLMNKTNLIKLTLSWGCLRVIYPKDEDIPKRSLSEKGLVYDKGRTDLMEENTSSSSSNFEDEGWIYNIDIVYEQVDLKKIKQKHRLAERNARELQEGVMETLQPHSNLEELIIEDYKGCSFGSWLGDPGFSKLVSIKLHSTSNCQQLPPLGQLPSLRHLHLREIYRLQTIGQEFYGYGSLHNIAFPSLETFELEQLFSLEEWFGIENGTAFPRLQQLRLEGCSRLQVIPNIFISLRKLVIHNYLLLGRPALRSLPTVPSLTHLEILVTDEKILSFLHEDLLPELRTLKFSFDNNTEAIHLNNLSSLQELEILGGSCSLVGLQSLLSLKSLVIRSSKMVWSPDEELPPNLEYLDISHCRSLTEWFLQHGRSRLVHIPEVRLNDKVVNLTGDEEKAYVH